MTITELRAISFQVDDSYIDSLIEKKRYVDSLMKNATVTSGDGYVGVTVDLNHHHRSYDHGASLNMAPAAVAMVCSRSLRPKQAAGQTRRRTYSLLRNHVPLSSPLCRHNQSRKALLRLGHARSSRQPSMSIACRFTGRLRSSPAMASTSRAARLRSG